MPSSTKSDISISIANFAPRSFEGRRIALFAINLRASETTTIVGDNCSGKSTIAHAICDACRDSAHLAVSSESLSILPSLQLGYQGVLYLPEESELAFTSQTVLDEVSFTLRNSTASPREGLARLQTVINQFSLDGLLWRKLTSLSGGQRQRVLIAALVVANPRLLITDDFTTNLDPAQIAALRSVIVSEIQLSGGAWLEFTRRMPRSLSQHNLRTLADGVLHAEAPLDEYHGTIASESEGRSELSGENSGLFLADAALLCRDLLRTNKIIEFRGIRYEYPEAGFMLNIPALTIGDGITVILGPNGCGKTTLLRLVSGIANPHFGQILVGGKQVGPRVLRNSASIVLQNPRNHFLTTSVLADITHAALAGGLPLGVERATKLLDRFGLRRFEHHDPSVCTPSVQRRLAVVLALLKQQAVFCLDEPTLGQDLKNMQSLARFFQAFADQGARLLLVSHDMAFVEMLRGRCLMMREGSIVDDVPIQALQARLRSGEVLPCYR